MYNTLRQSHRDKVLQRLEDGEITEEEADEELADFDAGYGDYMYDCWKDCQMEEAWAGGDYN